MGPAARGGGAFALTVTTGNSTSGPSFEVVLVGGVLTSGAAAGDIWFFGNLSLSVLPLTITPASSDVGRPATLATLVFGGHSTPYGFSWEGLPPGCLSLDAESLTCTPSSASPFPFQVSVVVSDSSGVRVQSPTVAWTVNPLPQVTQFTALPSPLSPGSPLTVTVLYSGGTGPLQFQYFDLPAGCASLNVSQFSCDPQTTGSFTVRVLITDVDGTNCSASTIVVVTKLAMATSTLWVWETALAAALIAIGIITAVVMVRRKAGTRGPPRQNTNEPSGVPSGIQGAGPPRADGENDGRRGGPG